jgi:hypothetical protein
MPASEKAAAFRTRATELRSLADRDRSSRLRADLLRAAQEWDDLAKRVEQDGRPMEKAKLTSPENI